MSRAASRGPSGRGRPRKPGERYPSGALKPPPPNPIVLARRRARVGADGDVTKATTDLDVALARGWIEADAHRAARDYARLYRRAAVGLPRLRTRDLGEAEGEHARDAPADDGDSSAICGSAASRAAAAAADGDPHAQARLRRLWAVLAPDHRRVLAHACLVEGELDFVTRRCRGEPGETRLERDLKAALEVVRAELSRPLYPAARLCVLRDGPSGLLRMTNGVMAPDFNKVQQKNKPVDGIPLHSSC